MQRGFSGGDSGADCDFRGEILENIGRTNFDLPFSFSILQNLSGGVGGKSATAGGGRKIYFFFAMPGLTEKYSFPLCPRLRISPRLLPTNPATY